MVGRDPHSLERRGRALWLEMKGSASGRSMGTSMVAVGKRAEPVVRMWWVCGVHAPSAENPS